MKHQNVRSSTHSIESLSRLRKKSPQQSGVVMVIALILMAVIGVSSAVSMKAALSDDLLTQNTRAESLAYQAAESALRWCEQQMLYPEFITRNSALRASSASAIIESDVTTTPSTWVGKDIWFTSSGTNSPAVLNADILRANYAAGYRRSNYGNLQPRCLVERYRPPSTSTMLDVIRPFTRGWVITAVGYSPDYSRANNDASGSEVWLQSTISLVRYDMEDEI